MTKETIPLVASSETFCLDTKSPYCDSCLDAVREEGAADDIAEECLSLMGEDIADHLCDKTESDGEVSCACPCTDRVRA